MAPPFTFVMERSRPSSRSTARYWGAKASFTSTRAILSRPRPVISMARCVAGTGPMPMILGSQPLTPHPTRRAIGFRPFFSAHFASAITSDAAPSQIPLAFPGRDESVLFKYWTQFSQRLKGREPRMLVDRKDGLTLSRFQSDSTISSLKYPFSWACCHRLWLSTATWSTSSRWRPYLSARFSAVSAIGRPV